MGMHGRRAVLKMGALALTVAAFGRRADAAPVVLTRDPRLADVVDPDARLLELYGEGRWCEGPCWAPALGGLVFSDVRRNRLQVLHDDGTVDALRDPSDNANGNVLDAEGRLVTCEHRTRRVVRREADGSLTVLADRFDDKPLNSPNDAVLAPDGAIWFTDPVYGIRQPDEGLMAEPEQTARRVYRIDPGGRLDAMIDTIDQPNGIALSPDGQTLYVAESGAALNPEGPREIRVFAIQADGRPDEGRVFATLDSGVPDGLAVDSTGRLYAACEEGVRIYDPDGTWLGRIATPGPAANVAFGGAERRRLFIASGTSIHAIDLKARGLAL
ncbi:SMP-30/gluconolactonase/LRE family protein [Aureimonas sp. Leaf324]|jgi:gluconolactonase|uniref:SMP-30/gluconolactonase/LRE family protein n=1 Tax=Aureimonas sp. Leaf324 TaxID=1736336 RepID=UPI000A705FF0|nr:SMP-30/gluconolactonase/LRE family protein [Aureimonas sp. Leaf324]